ncbi:MAG TPA: signal recognition particle-docking protein FtsY [Candidatus Brocadiia bacterium]|nr:signal recognition particle-docking protein FtsY [Candidatus Brocadiia bacterium]
MAWKPLKFFKKDDAQKTEQEGETKPADRESAEVAPATASSEEPKAQKKSWLTGSLEKLKGGLRKTRDKLSIGVRTVLAAGRELDEATIAELEEQLFQADIGPRAVDRLIGHIRRAYKMREIRTTDQVLDYLKTELKKELGEWDTSIRFAQSGPTVILVAGVNGSGKTTSIAKLAKLYCDEGKKVVLAASDTFRAAAVEQLTVWAGRVGAEIVRNESADPAAVAFDAADKALARGFDVLIVDTAGRLHTRETLMEELTKIRRVLERKIPGAPHEVLLVLDATTGQNAISQAEKFTKAINVTGLVLAKLDGTAKGGIVLGMRDQIDIPVKFVGLGEKADDLEPFDAGKFVDAIFD